MSTMPTTFPDTEFIASLLTLAAHALDVPEVRLWRVGDPLPSPTFPALLERGLPHQEAGLLAHPLKGAGDMTRALLYVTCDPADPWDAQAGATLAQSATLIEQHLSQQQTLQQATTKAKSAEMIQTIHQIGQVLSAELDLQKLVQAVTDIATELVRAQFGAFFYNVIDQEGERYTLYTISGVPASAFDRFPMPRNTPLFGPTFRGEGTVLIDNVREDARFGKNAPYHGMPEGHLPVTSYLAVSVTSRSGEVIGGLFFGHSEEGVFSEWDVQLLEGLAAQVAIAVDNARLFEQVQRERIKAEQSEQNYRLLSEAIPQMVWSTRPDGWVEYFNQRWYEYTGLTPAESEGWDWQVVIHPDDRQRCLDGWSRAVRTGQPYTIEYRLRQHDGQYRWHLGKAVPLLDGTGKVRRWFGTCTEIHEQKRAEVSLRFLAEVNSALAPSLDFEATVQQLARLAVPLLADHCVVDIVEDSSLKLVAVAHRDPAKEDLLQSMRQQYPPDFSNDHHPLLRVLHSGRAEIVPSFTEEELMKVALGPEHHEMILLLGPRSYMVVPLIARGRTLGAMTFTMSESGRQHTEDDLALAEELAHRAAIALDNARLYQAAQAAIRARDEFLSVAAHELKTPMTSLRGFAQLLLRKMEQGQALDIDRLQRILRTIDEQSNKLTHLIEQLLDISRIEAGRLALERQESDLPPLIEHVVRGIQAISTHHTLQVESEPHLLAWVDPLRLEQVLTNLINNAIKYSPIGGKVNIALQQKGKRFRLSVTDQGGGVPAEHQAHIFERFYQAHDEGAMGGMGLGLYITRQIVELHGGQIWLEQPPAGGSRFVLELPLYPDEEENTDDARAEHRPSGGTEPGP